jgi:hypothetical protein
MRWAKDLQYYNNELNKEGPAIADPGWSIRLVYSALKIASTLSFASPNNIEVFSLKNNGF